MLVKRDEEVGRTGGEVSRPQQKDLRRAEQIIDGLDCTADVVSISLEQKLHKLQDAFHSFFCFCAGEKSEQYLIDLLLFEIIDDIGDNFGRAVFLDHLIGVHLGRICQYELLEKIHLGSDSCYLFQTLQNSPQNLQLQSPLLHRRNKTSKHRLRLLFHILLDTRRLDGQ